MRLGKRQKSILVKMATGWELGVSLGRIPAAWIQDGGLGRGGKTDHNISLGMVLSLENKELIKVTYDKFPKRGYKLTYLGEEVAKDIIAG